MTQPANPDPIFSSQQHLQKRLTATWNVFFARFGRLKPIQLAAMGPILDGQDTLITAPTAGGKTEAAIAPLWERLKQQRWPGLAIILITPTRALVNDLYERLTRPADMLGIELRRKTADHGYDPNRPGQVLITTPESVESLLLHHKTSLTSARAVVLDEIHLLDGTPRGDQLRFILQRLELLVASTRPNGGATQRVAMSATVPDPVGLMHRYLRNGARLVSVSGSRIIEAHCILTEGSDEERIPVVVASVKKMGDVEKVLVFVNSRIQVDRGVKLFQDAGLGPHKVFGHHGSLAKGLREKQEQAFKEAHRAICVATMTLEVGIDIGDVDLVVCIDPPFSLPSFLQRVGRGCRRRNDKTRVLCVARDHAGELIFSALLHQAKEGLPAGPTAPFRRSVAQQQVIAYLGQVNQNSRLQNQLHNALTSEATPAIDADCLNAILESMVHTQYLSLQNRVYRPASLGWDFIHSGKVYSNISSSGGIPVVDVNSGQTVAYLAGWNRENPSLTLAGKTFKVLDDGKDGLRVRLEPGTGGNVRYRSKKFPLGGDMGRCLANFLSIDSSTVACINLGGERVWMTWLGRLLNAALGAGLAPQCANARPEAFAIWVTGARDGDPLTLIKDACQRVLKKNPLGGLPVEQYVDVGRHFAILSAAQQREAREDWLDRSFLENWVQRLSVVKRVSVDSALGRDLIELAML